VADPARHTPDRTTEGTETVNTETVDPETIDPETVGTETVGTETVGTETVGTETVDTETANPETAYPGTADTETVNTETVNTPLTDHGDAEPAPGTAQPDLAFPGYAGTAAADPVPLTGRRGPDPLALLVGLATLAMAVFAFVGELPDLSGVDPRWLLAGGAAVVGLVLLVGSLRGRAGSRRGD
jgi:hypothetical protein